MSGITFDIEANNLLNEESIDYNASPFVLRDSFQVHCLVVEEHDTGDIIAFYDGETYELDGRKYEEIDGDYVYTLEDYEPIEYEHRQLGEFAKYIKENKPATVVAHNSINYDLLVCKMFFDMDYSVGPDTWAGFETDIVDTMVLSKCLNPDRFGGHSLEKLAAAAKRSQKVDFRKYVPQKDRFNTFAADMLYYNIFDVKANTAVWDYLKWEMRDWDWEEAIALEKAVAEIITRQEHRGFKFDRELAESNVKELDILMEERKVKVEPLLPARPATQAFLKNYTPPARQTKKNGDATSYLEKFVQKHGGSINEDVTEVELLGNVYSLPMALEPIVDSMPATINDTTHIKNWLVGLGWSPSEYKEKDLTLKSGTKIKREGEDLVKAVDRYVEETLKSNFKEDRLEKLDMSNLTETQIKRRILKQAEKRSVKVYTNPSFTVGQEKELCPDLSRIAEKFPYVQDIVEYLTYKHRRNSILGGGLEWDEEEEAEKGYLANIREDGRIPTPADTCGAATSRMKHKVVANVPRITSLYGENMRGLFGVDKGYLQVGYDFDSLEARIEAHYCWRYDKSKEYCESLTLPKPLDVHTKTAAAIAEIIGKDFARGSAKGVKYGCTYGAQAAKVAKTIGSDLVTGELVFDAFWEAALPLKKLKEALARYWKNTGKKKFILGIDGRKVPTRAEHAILNSLFQSGGVICAKRTMVYHDRLLKKEGLAVDFFRDDWKNKNFMQQLVAYHDECQLEEKIKNFTFKVFDNKEEAEYNRDSLEGIWSEPIKGKNDKWVIAKSKACELIQEAVDMTTERYNLNVPLTAGYIVGYNWKDCH